jgi:hypothetical protein
MVNSPFGIGTIQGRLVLPKSLSLLGMSAAVATEMAPASNAIPNPTCSTL